MATEQVRFKWVDSNKLVGPFKAIVFDLDDAAFGPVTQCSQQSEPLLGAGYIHSACDIVRVSNVAPTATKAIGDARVTTIMHGAAAQSMVRCRWPIEKLKSSLELSATALAGLLSAAAHDVDEEKRKSFNKRSMERNSILPTVMEWRRSISSFAMSCRVFRMALREVERIPLCLKSVVQLPGLKSMTINFDDMECSIEKTGRVDYGRWLEYQQYQTLGGGPARAWCDAPISMFGDRWLRELAKTVDAYSVYSEPDGLSPLVALIGRSFFSDECKTCIVATGHTDLLGDDKDDIFDKYRLLADALVKHPSVEFLVLHPLYSYVYADKWAVLRQQLIAFDQWPGNVRIVGIDPSRIFSSWPQLDSSLPRW